MSQTVRMQHLIPATLVLVLAGTVTWLSFTREPADAFLFPRIISVAMILLALWNFARAALGLARVGAGFTYTQLLRLLPGVVVMCIYVFFAARWLGFYTASLITFITILACEGRQVLHCRSFDLLVSEEFINASDRIKDQVSP